ncbi:hypothetical protein HYT32_02155 [Candidatus Roizmanbacteria bacterium]|nr:hypothetical protein [Candidatus Roizmanbacteria bacterium]
MPNTTFFLGRNKVEASGFALSVYDSSGNLTFSASPLDDYYYEGTARNHLQNRLMNSNNGGFIEQTRLTIENFLFKKKSIIWKAVGDNGEGEVLVEYAISPRADGLKIVRTIEFIKNIPDSIGQTIKICQHCLVVDDKKRAYSNGDSKLQQHINTASRLNFVPVILRKNQAFPSDISKIIIVTFNGKEQIEIPISGSQVFMEDSWYLLEFKSNVKKNKKIQLEQEFYIRN